MTRPKIVLLYSPDFKDWTEIIMSFAPSGMEVDSVDSSLSDEEKIPLCKDADALMLIIPDISAKLLGSCPKVKLIQTLSAGYDQLDVTALNEFGIPIANNGGANAIAVAEHTIALMISVCKRMMAQWHTAVNERRWQGTLKDVDMVEISNKTIGIVGLGRIGKQVAKRLMGFDTRTLYYDIQEMPLEVQQELNAQPVQFEELLHQSDIVSLHVPLTARTAQMIGERELGMMKPTAFLISTCRGAVIEERALFQALNDRRIAAAGLDVLEQEPTPPDSPLFELDNLIITPHMAGSTVEAELRAAEFAYDNIKRVLAGEPPESLIRPDY